MTEKEPTLNEIFERLDYQVYKLIVFTFEYMSENEAEDFERYEFYRRASEYFQVYHKFKEVLDELQNKR